MANTKNRRNKEDKKSDNGKLEEEVNKAFQSVTMTKFRTEQLHNNWRAHLQRLAVGVVFLTMHQYSQPVRDCIIDIKSIQPEIEVPNPMAFKMIFSDGLVELVNLVIAILHYIFLSNTKEAKEFAARPYLIAAALVPFCVGLFFHTERTGCMIDSDGDFFQRTLDHENQLTKRQFPVAVLFHLIVTVCVYFMNMGMGQCDKNVEAIEKLRNGLLQPKKGSNSKKKKQQ